LAGLKLYTGNRLEDLARKLAEVLSTPLSSPLDTEVIVVQSKGMERWVRMQLARYHGICANVQFPFPNAIVREFFCKVFAYCSPEDAYYDPPIMTWKIMGLVQSCIKKPGFESIRFYLGDHIRQLKWFQLSERIADTFDQYLVYRPDMILKWETGKGGQWQPKLWRKLVNGHQKSHRAALKKALLERVQKRSVSAQDLPQRISVFGISTLPPYHTEVLAAVSELIEVNVFLMNPCREYWADIVSDHDMRRFMKKEALENNGSETFHLERGNSLLASMGALGRDFFAWVTDLECESHECFHDIEARDMLSCIQSDILLLRERGGLPHGKTIVSEEDTSIQVHSCHSPMREMEVLHDNLLLMFEQDPNLAPRDILVMTPDIETVAPFVQAVFGATDDNSKRIPFSIADRSARSESPVADAFLAILGLRSGRFNAIEVLSILECPPIQQRFNLSEADLGLVHRWVTETRINWGIDADYRKKMDLPPFPENTWRFGLDRLLLGYAMPGKGEQLFKGILPYDNVEGGDTCALGKFVDFAEALFSCVGSLSGQKTLSEWSQILTGLLDTFFLPDGQAGIEIQMIQRTLYDLIRQEALSGFHEKVELEVIQAYMLRHLETEGFGFGFITGGVTFCAMLPMRSIPFRVICLVGMNNDAYPRQTRGLGFDLMARHPRQGDRSRRKDDRYLFLEAILSARKILYISYVGQSALDNSRIPPSAIVSELLDYLEKGFKIPRMMITDHITTNHRLQAFSPTYFKGRKKFFSYSDENLDAARVSRGDRRQAEPFISNGLSEPPAEGKALELRQLTRFFINPARFLLNERLGIHLETPSNRPNETEPLSVHGLDKYILEQTLVEKRLSGKRLRELFPVVKASGQLPHGSIGQCVYESSRQGIEKFVGSIENWTGENSLSPIELNHNIAGFELSARVPNIYPKGLIQYRYTQLKVTDHLRLWFPHLLLNIVCLKDYPRQSILLGKDERWVYSPVEEGEKILGRLLEIYWEGLRRPTHFFPESSLKYAEAIIWKGKAEDDALNDTRNTWTGNEYNRGECQDHYYQLCFGGTDPLDQDFRKLAEEIFNPLLRSRKRITI
jgi:exodeoxyribonuclease V gamma subunit